MRCLFWFRISIRNPVAAPMRISPSNNQCVPEKQVLFFLSTFGIRIFTLRCIARNIDAKFTKNNAHAASDIASQKKKKNSRMQMRAAAAAATHDEREKNCSQSLDELSCPWADQSIRRLISLDARRRRSFIHVYSRERTVEYAIFRTRSVWNCAFVGRREDDDFLFLPRVESSSFGY